MHRTLAICTALIVLCGCPTPAPVIEPDDDVKERPRARQEEMRFEGQPVAVSNQFGYDCTSVGETEEIVGVVEMLDFGKGRRGVIIDDGDAKWVVSYNADGVFEDFEKEKVLATGSPCQKQGEAIKAYHFEVRSLRVIASP